MEDQVKNLVEFINSHPEIVEQYPDMKGLLEPFAKSEEDLSLAQGMGKRNALGMERPAGNVDTSLRQESQDIKNRVSGKKQMTTETFLDRLVGKTKNSYNAGKEAPRTKATITKTDRLTGKVVDGPREIELQPSSVEEMF